MKIPVFIDGYVYLFWALYLFLLGPEWTIAILIASAFHELGHILALIHYKIPIRQIFIHPVGAEIQCSIQTGRAGVICTAAGPIAGSLLILLYFVYPKLAFSALVQTTLNLLPLSKLDGGRIIQFLREEKAVAKSFDTGYNNSD